MIKHARDPRGSQSPQSEEYLQQRIIYNRRPLLKMLSRHFTAVLGNLILEPGWNNVYDEMEFLRLSIIVRELVRGFADLVERKGVGGHAAQCGRVHMGFSQECFGRLEGRKAMTQHVAAQRRVIVNVQ